MRQANACEPLAQPVVSQGRKSVRDFATISRLRRTVQAAFALLCLLSGYRFWQFYRWAIGQSNAYVARPPSVEGFLPISALLGLKRFVITGRWDEVHPAGLAIFLSALALALLLRKSFCGWICPVGFASNIAGRLGRAWHFDRQLPEWLDYPLLGAKYLILVFFCYVILWEMDVPRIEAFVYSRYNQVVDAKMLLFFLHPSLWTLRVLSVLFLLSLVVRNFWCRYLCPYGALLGLGALLGPVQVRRDASLCLHCKECERVCPVSIRISRHRIARHPECIGCAECVEACPRSACLSLKGFTGKSLPLYAFPIAVVGVFCLFWIVALSTGHWHTVVPLEVFRRLYPEASLVAHP